MNMNRLAIAASLAAAVAAVALPAQARNALPIQPNVQTSAMKDDSTLYVFSDGKMALEDKFGRAVNVKPGSTLETKNGRQVTIVGNEVARLDGLLNNEHRN